MISFEQFWELHAPMAQYQPMRKFCEKIWNDLPPAKQEIIFANIRRKKEKHQFVDYNPYYAIQKNGNPPRQLTLTMSQYYERYNTTAETDGWHQANPTGNQVIYIKTN